MSIYGTTLSFGDDFEDEQPGAIAYEGSHVYPDVNNRTAEFDLGVIPGHIAEGGGHDEEHEHWAKACHRPFLRMGFHDPYGGQSPDRHAPPTSGTIVLDAKQVEELRDNLTDFLERITGDWCLEGAEEDRAKGEAYIASLKEEQP